ncbi:hypothetical protein D3C87_517820 [compost metagenome]
MALDYFYDGQFRAYIVQVIRALSGFQCQNGINADGTPKLRTVPVTWAPQDKQVASIIKNNSENTVLSTPQISVFITNIDIPAERRQAPNHVSTLNVHEREIDTTNNKYTQLRGKSYTVERFMPVAYDITFQIDIWTSNLHQKCELLEQIMVLFNPGIDLQTSTNALDWTALTTMSMQSVTWSTRGIPIGTSTDIDLATLTLKVPAWINPPAKVQRQKIIEQIITNISALNVEDVELNKDFDRSAIDWARGDVFQRSIVTPGDHHVEVNGDVIRLLGEDTKPLNNLNEPWNWVNLFELYGKYRPGISQIRLKTNDDMDDHETDVVGTIQVDNEDPSILYFNIDIATLPMNNLPAISGVIDPHKTWPGNAANPIPTPTVGDRYMILNEIAPNTTWGTFGANANDIIEYDATGQWVVAFDSEEITGSYTLLNSRTGKQLSWRNRQWVVTLAGNYGPGYWRIAL